MVPLWEECELWLSVKYFNVIGLFRWVFVVLFCWFDFGKLYFKWSNLSNCSHKNDHNILIEFESLKMMESIILTPFSSYLFCLLSLDQFFRCLLVLLFLSFSLWSYYYNCFLFNFFSYLLLFPFFSFYRTQTFSSDSIEKSWLINSQSSHFIIYT